MKKFLVTGVGKFTMTYAVEAESAEEAQAKIESEDCEIDDIKQVWHGVEVKSAVEATNEQIEEAADEYLKGRVMDMYFNENSIPQG